MTHSYTQIITPTDIPETQKHRKIHSNLFLNLFYQIKSLDGVDEVAQALGQILPGIAGPIATLSVISVATPFVCIGALGMKDEYVEICHEYHEILERKVNSAQKLRELSQCSEKWRHFLATKLKLELPPSPKKPFIVKEPSLNHAAHQIVEFEKIKNEAFIAAIGKKYGWTGVVGMTGMSLAMLPTMLKSCINIAQETGKQSAALTGAANGLSLTSTITFGIGQIGMFIYGASKVRQGIAIRKTLQAGKKNFLKHASPALEEQTTSAITEIIDKDLNFNNKTHLQYGIATDIGQSLMISSTILNLIPGLGTAISIPLIAIGAPITVGAAIWRIVHERKERNFRGEGGNDYAKTRVDHTSLLHLFDISMEKNEVPIQVLQEEFKFCTQQLARIKLYSLLHKFIDNRKYSTLSKKMERLDYLLAHQKIATSLKGTILDQVKTIYFAEREHIYTWLSLPSPEAQKILLANIIQCATLQKENDIENLRFNLAPDSQHFDQLPSLLKALNLQDKTMLKKRINGIEDKDYKQVNQCLIPALKSSLKFIRYDLSEKLVQLSHIESMKEDIKKHEKESNLPTFSHAPISLLPHRSDKEIENNRMRTNHCFGNLSFHQRFQDRIEKDSKQLYTILKDHLSNQPEELDSALIKKQQTALNNFREKAAKFFLAEESLDEHGNQIMKWDDPRFVGQNKSDYQITYIINERTGKMTVKYGIHASAIIVSNSDSEKKTGIFVAEITQGKHQLLGDTQHQCIELERNQSEEKAANTTHWAASSAPSPSWAATSVRQRVNSTGYAHSLS